MSKAYGAPGLRIGWLTVPGPELREQLRLARFNTALSCGSLDEFLAARLLRRADEVLATRGAVLAQARGIAERWVKGHRGRLAWLRPQAGGFCCVRLEPAAFGLEEIEGFHAYLAEQRVLVAPGPWFGDSAHVVRLGLAYEPPDRLEAGLEIIGAALEAAGR
jgi:DNA-binding transcriptional MocR family regulator